MGGQNDLFPSDYTIVLTPEQEKEFKQLDETYGISSEEVTNFVQRIVEEYFIILDAIEEKAHARIH